jgi:hypothetical protein
MTLLQVLRFLLSCVGGAFFYWVYFDPRFRDAEGYLLGTFCLPVSIGVALIVLGWTIDGRFRRFSLWFGLGLLGQAVALQMIDAGPLVRYQHFKPIIQLVHSYPLLLLFLLLQTALVVAGCATRWGIIRAWAGRTFKIWQLAGVVIIFILSSAVVSRDVPIYITELLFAAFVQAVNLGNIVLMVWALPEEILLSWKRRIERSFGQSGSESRGTSVDPQVSWTEDRQSTIQNLKSKIQNLISPAA